MTSRTPPTKVSIERREGHFMSRPSSGVGAELFFQSWTGANANATLVVTHGISEHSECYSKTAEALVALGWNVIAWDLRGHGRSEGKRGHVDAFLNYSEDLGQLLQHLGRNSRLELPFALVGHSMGGLVTLRYLLDEDTEAPKPQALALSSPLLGVALTVPPVKDFAARILNRIYPSMTMHNEIRYEDLTRDHSLLGGYALDPLRHDKISPALYLGMFETIEYVKSRASEIHLPTLLQAAGEERIVSLPAIKEFFPTIGAENKKLIVYEGSFHEIYNDLDRETVFLELDAFLAPAIGVSRKHVT